MDNVSLAWLVGAFVISLAYVLFTIIKLKFHPFLSLLTGGILMGILSKMPLEDIGNLLSSGFGSTMGGIGIIIVWGVVLGNLLHKSGCTEEIAALMLRLTGEKRTSLAVALTGYIVSIPVFFDAAFVILINLIKQLARKGKIPFITLVTALATGLITTHAMVIPTPGPLAVAGEMQANLGAFFVYGAIASLTGVLVAGVWYANRLGKRPEYANDFANAFEDEFTEAEEAVAATGTDKPSGGLGIMLILLPIILILVGTIGTAILKSGTVIYDILAFIGNKNIALMAGAIIAFLTLRKYLTHNLEEVITDSAKDSGIIFLITGAGGAFGAIINATGIGTKIVDVIEGSGMTGATASVVLILVAWFISQILRAAQGSTTVALITTSAILAPLVIQLNATANVVSPVLVGLAICAGGIGISLPNDSGFWVVNRFSKFTVKDTFAAWTIPGTISGVISLIVVLILSLMQSFLPGMF
jgi:GntP family gluconate:H+ symporter